MVYKKKIIPLLHKLAYHTVAHFGSSSLEEGVVVVEALVSSRRFLHHVGVIKIYSKKLNLTKSQTSSATSQLSSRRALAVGDGVDASSVSPG